MTVPKLQILDAIDRYGGDFSTWPDPALATAARAAALADPDVRASLDAMRDVTRALDGVRAGLDDEIDESGAESRIADSVLTGLGLAPARRWRRLAVAAALLVAAGLGGVYEFAHSSPTTGFDVVVLDPLVFGPAGFDQ